MDAAPSTEVSHVLTSRADPRPARGRRSPWPVLLTLIAAALASGQQGVRASAQWVAEQAEEGARGRPRGGAPPQCGAAAPHRPCPRSRHAGDDLGRLHPGPARATPPAEAPPAAPWGGLALDGKAVGGANRHGAQVHLPSLVRHDDGRVLDELGVPDKPDEISAAPTLFARQELHGTVVTMDALLTQREIARTIRAQGGHSLMVVQQHQPELGAASTLWFTPPPPDAPRLTVADRVPPRTKGHGRLAVRHLERRAARNSSPPWPDGGQVRRPCPRVPRGTGELSDEGIDASTRHEHGGRPRNAVARARDERESRPPRPRPHLRRGRLPGLARQWPPDAGRAAQRRAQPAP